MPKLLYVLVVSSLIFFSLSVDVFPVLAADCKITTIPPTLDSTTKELRINVKSNSLALGEKYILYISHKGPGGTLIDETYSYNVGRDASKNLPTGIEYAKTYPNGLAPGAYQIEFYDTKPAYFGTGLFDAVDVNKIQCSLPITVQEVPKNTSCQVTVKDKEKLTPADQIEISPSGLSSGSYKLEVRDTKTGEVSASKSFNVVAGSGTALDPNIPTSPITFNSLKSGAYQVIVRDGNSSLVCSPVAFQVGVIGQANPGSPGSGPGASGGNNNGQVTVSGSGLQAAGQSCEIDKGTSPAPANTPPEKIGLMTAIGCVPTSPEHFIKGFLRVLTLALGGIALLLMISGAFKMITSAGNQNSLKAGGEQMSSAVIGLLFIIFSVLLLRVLGVDILQIPGFA